MRDMLMPQVGDQFKHFLVNIFAFLVPVYYNPDWKYKGGDEIDDAKSELIYLLVGAKKAEFNKIWKQANKIADLEKYQPQWMSFCKDGNLEKLKEELFEKKRMT